MKKNIIRFLYLFKRVQLRGLIWFLSILYLEILFVVFISKTFSLQLLINILFSSIIISKLLNIFVGLFKGKIKVFITGIILYLFGFFFSFQAIFYKVFKTYFSLYNIGLSDQIKGFEDEAIKFIFKNYYCIGIFILPFILFLIINTKKKINYERNNKNDILYLLITILIWVGLFRMYVNNTKNIRYSDYDLYNDVNNVSLNIKRLGVLNNTILEIDRSLFGFTPKKIDVVSLNEKSDEDIKYGENKLDLDLNDTDNYNVNIINNYVKDEEATLKNKYTGMFKGYNLIYITAEGFSEIGIDKELTPTLYKLTHSGFTFNNFYTPNNLSTIGGEFQSLTGLYPDYGELDKWRDGTNAFPFGLGYTYKRNGYNTYAFHNNSYVFQDRDKYLASQGFNNFLACYNGLEKRMNCEVWPQSDDKMIEVTTDDYMNSDNPFMTYYMTVSGHLEYNFSDNYMSYKNRSLVENLDKSEEAKAYVATQIELDRALERLIKSLKEHNKLDNTVIVLMADHYPYGLDNDAINELSSYYRDDIEVNRNALIIWNNKMDNVVVDKPCMAIDVLPTVYNLFGIDYDSRLFTGKDILSNSFGIAILADRSWVTNKGSYYAPTNQFIAKEEVDENYVDTVNTLVNSRLNISKMIIENNYYSYIAQ